LRKKIRPIPYRGAKQILRLASAFVLVRSAPSVCGGSDPQPTPGPALQAVSDRPAALIAADTTKDFVAHLNRGIANGTAANFEKAIGDFNAALLLNPRSADAYYDRGVSYQSLGNGDLAAKDYSEAIEISPTYAKAYYNLGLIHVNRSDNAQALVDFSNAIAADPRFAEAYCNRGLVLKIQRNNDQAIADLSKAISIKPDLTAAYDGRGWAHYQKRDYQAAIADFQKAIEIDGKSGKGYNALGWFLSVCPVDGIRDGKRAVQLATLACELSDWKNPDYLDTLSAACAETGDFASAIKWEQKCLENGPSAELKERVGKQMALYENKRPIRW
jgi:tetratricopeptide (TPR) repeat protein